MICLVLTLRCVLCVNDRNRSAGDVTTRLSRSMNASLERRHHRQEEISKKASEECTFTPRVSTTSMKIVQQSEMFAGENQDFLQRQKTYERRSRRLSVCVLLCCVMCCSWGCALLLWLVGWVGWSGETGVEANVLVMSYGDAWIVGWRIPSSLFLSQLPDSSLSCLSLASHLSHTLSCMCVLCVSW